jgi:hypothetical protein
MKKVRALWAIAVMGSGCIARTPAWKGTVEWPDEQSAKPVGTPMEAGAILAAAGAIREQLRGNSYPGVFYGCESPEQGLVASVFTGPTKGLYYVMVDYDFQRCAGPRFRVLDGWDVYAVTPRGEVVAKDPSGPGEGSPRPEASPPSALPPSIPPEPASPVEPSPAPMPGGDGARNAEPPHVDG